MKIMRTLLFQRIPITQMRVDRPRYEALVFLAYAFGYVGYAVVIAWVITRWPLPILGSTQVTYDLWYVLLFKLVGMLVVPLWMFRRLGYRIADVAIDLSDPKSLGATTPIAFAIGLFLNAGRLAPIAAAVASHAPSWAVPRLALGLVLPLVQAGFPEEVVYRGVLQTRIEAWLGRAPAILVSTVLFVAWHLPSRFFHAHGIEGVAGDLSSVLLGTGVPVGIVGLVFALLWDRYRRLVPLIAAHWGIDVLPATSSLLGIDF